MKPTVIIRYHEDGYQEVITDVPVRVLYVDERCTSDRVYESMTDVVGEVGVAAIIGSSLIGSRYDGSPAQARAEAAVNGGKPALEIVK